MENLFVSLGFGKNPFPAKHTCDGENTSPRLEINRVEAPYLAVIVMDPDAPSGNFTHWLIWNIPATKGEFVIPEGIPKTEQVTSPLKGVQGKNDFGKIGYAGPCPPKGEEHRFFFNVYGFDAPLSLRAGANRQELEKAMEGKVVQYGGQAIAPYGR